MTLGLFPLHVVLFPDSRLPLHIFEPRYRTLIRECWEGGSSFGIHLIDHGHLYPVGCRATVVEMVEEYDDGRMDIMVQGTGRVRLLEMRTSDKPYAVAEVDAMEDVAEPVTTELQQQCIDLYHEVLAIAYGSEGEAYTIRSAEPYLSFKIAPKCGLSLDQKQHLLELTSERVRLEVLHDHLSELLPTLRKADLVQRIVRNDGYLPAIDSDTTS
ncbi:MAG: LON peptidase substrate-binding domain-containing protein [Candidatus Kapaibacteriota bacterium]